MYRVIVTRTDGSYCESMRFPTLCDAMAWAQWQEQTLGRKAQIIQ